MRYFPVRYDSRVVNYDHRGFIRLATVLLSIFRQRQRFLYPPKYNGNRQGTELATLETIS